MRVVTCALLLLAAGLLGCGGGPEYRPLTPDSVVLCFGDSLTAGYGAEEGESYPEVLATLLGCHVVNAGVSGEVSAEGVDRLPELLSEHKPALVVLCHGGNDLLRGVADAEVVANLRTMIEASQKAGAEVLVLGVPRPGLLLKVPPFYADVAQTCGVPYEGVAVKRVLSSPTKKSDLIHPNAAGYRAIAERVAGQIRKRQ